MCQTSFEKEYESLFFFFKFYQWLLKGWNMHDNKSRSNIMVYAMYNFANICLPFLLLQLLEQVLRSWPTTWRKKIGFICILCMRSKSRSRRCSTCRKIGFIKTTFSILINAVPSLCFSLWIYSSYIVTSKPKLSKVLSHIL